MKNEDGDTKQRQEVVTALGVQVVNSISTLEQPGLGILPLASKHFRLVSHSREIRTHRHHSVALSFFFKKNLLLLV